jgi:hypothetical protein
MRRALPDAPRPVPRARLQRSALRRLALVALALAASGGARPSAAQVPSPVLEGPVPGQAFLISTQFDLALFDYVQEEFFVSGTARAYTNVGELGEDGRWTVAPGESAEYRTRILVNRPADPRRFNGAVVVEWLNVSGGLEASPDWTLAHTELLRRGYAWVGVSAQYAGVEGGDGSLGVLILPLKAVNPARYASLLHPGDSFSYDLFSQVARAIRGPSEPDPLGGLAVKRILAAGESQSAFRLVTYIDAIHPRDRVYDGFFVHSRGAIGAPLSQAPQPSIPVPGAARIRDDVDVPVLTLETETDLTLLGYHAARQPDARNFRLWEVAGTAHADVYTLTLGTTDLGDSPDVVELVVTATPIPGIIRCATPINSGPQHFVVKAALRALDRWVRHGRPPRRAPRLELDPGPPVAIRRDAHGNALGGVRTPQVDAPIAAFTGEQEGSLLCSLFGTTTPFDAAKLAELYPSHRRFVSAWRRSLRRSVRAGWVLEPDAKLMRTWALGSDVGRGLPAPD